MKTFDIVRWRLVRITEHYVSYHLAGWVDARGKWRVSSPVCTFDPAAGTAVTASGNRYTLVGPKGYEPDLIWALDIWANRNGVTFADRDCDLSEISKGPSFMV